MSMEDILKVLVDSRQQPAAGSQSSADPMANLVGSLLGGGSGGQGAGLGQMMGALESIMGGGQQMGGSGDPVMALLTPFVTPLAKKANIPPEIAVVVVSFVAHKLLSHHPSSGRDSNSFDLDQLFGQMANGQINSNLLQSSGMVTELAQKTGLDEATAAKSLDLAFMLVGKSAIGLMNKSSASKPAATSSAPAKKLGATAKSGAVAKKPKK